MAAQESRSPTHERELRPYSGWSMLFFNLAVLLAGVALFVLTVMRWRYG
jgi:hypothetical protein